MDEEAQLAEADMGVSPWSVTAPDSFLAEPRFIELQEELRYVLFTEVSNSPNQQAAAEPIRISEEAPPSTRAQTLDLYKVPIPKERIVFYLKNWITECAPYLDKFDETRHFGIHVPIMAQTYPSLFYALLAFSARQVERCSSQKASYDSLELYQESIRLLAPSLQAKDPNVLISTCILAVLELMSGSSGNWKRHLQGCAALFERFEVHGFSGGVLQAVFWCYARMEMCGVIISKGLEKTVLPLTRWVPTIPASCTTRESSEDFIDDIFLQASSKSPDMHSNWAVYLLAKVCDLTCRRTQYLELGEVDESDTRPFKEQWSRLWNELQLWLQKRPMALFPVKVVEAGHHHIFPIILFSHWAAISGNQLYHVACVLMLQIIPNGISPQSPHDSAIWHARRVCGISWTNPHRGSLINSIQPLYVAARLLTHPAEHFEVGKIFKIIERTTGWGALWRLHHLEAEWGYKSGEIMNTL